MSGAKVRRYAGWGLSGLLAALFLFSAAMKFAAPEEVVEGFAKLGLTEKRILIAVGEAASAVLFLIPRTSSLGLLLLSSYMGGAILAHMSHGEDYTGPSVILLLVWLAGYLRVPGAFASFRGTPAPAPKAETVEV